MANGRVLVIGSGGREHALAWALASSKHVGHVYVCPGNAGTHGKDQISNIALNIKDHTSVAEWCKKADIGLVVVGPEDPLADGIADHLRSCGVLCFGPSAKAAQIESSKAFSKDFMSKYSIPTAKGEHFSSIEAAHAFINSASFPALVVKASGLAAGKGVIVAQSKKEACDAVTSMLKDGKFGSAGQTVLVEEKLEGPEISVFGLSDGELVLCFPPAQDHKRLEEGDRGPNTGGMGAYAPYSHVTENQLKEIETGIMQRAIDGMRQEGMPFAGLLFAGIMLTDSGPKVLEFNCRFGDPETQVILPLLKSDLYELLMHCVNGSLNETQLEVHTDRSCVAVVCVSDGYPGAYKKGVSIAGLKEFENGQDQMVFHAGTKDQAGDIVTNGGRVLATVAIDNNITSAQRRAVLGSMSIDFEGKFFRRDIGYQAMMKKLSYSAAGVNIDAGESFVDKIKPFAASTARSGCQADLGGFGGLFDLKAAGFKNPLLVSGTDGVGTKLEIAQQCRMHGTVGIDLVAMCVNDVLCHGAEPLFFLDYFACGKLDVSTAASVVKGITDGCKMAGAALLGGETAEMPGMYPNGVYDLAGFTVGAVEREDYLPKTKDILATDIIIGLPSVGVHSNGFSLVRRLIETYNLSYSTACPFDETQTLGESLLKPTRIYTSAVKPVLKHVKAVAHITGGGLPGNVCRIIPDHLAAEMDALSWPMLPVFSWIFKQGNVDASEMAKTFNCGLGLVLAVAKDKADLVLKTLKDAGEEAFRVGHLAPRCQGSPAVNVRNLAKALESAQKIKIHSFTNGSGFAQKRKRVGVLISGSGTNLQALIDHTQSSNSSAEIVLVISNKPNVGGLKRAEAAGIPTLVISHKDFDSRDTFDAALHSALVDANVDIVCLAGFMRILTGGFVRKWTGRMLNVHPSLLPSFKGANAHRMVLEAGVCLSGCSVHFVVEEVDGGAILVQESVPVYPSDTEDTLADRVKSVEHRAFPKALELLASGAVSLGVDGKALWKV